MKKSRIWLRAGQWAGVEQPVRYHAEKFVSGLGGVVGIGMISLVTHWFVPDLGAVWIVASMGAATVLVFAVPHGPLSQPWPLVGGNIISAVIGVTVAGWVPDPALGGPLAVGLAIFAMHYLRCIHPPGGATALVATVGGPSIAALGYQYVWTPVALNVMILLITGVVFNAFFPWRRYPAAWAARKPGPKPKLAPVTTPLKPADLDWALQQMGSFIDVSEEDLEELLRLAGEHARLAKNG
ncbi:MAG: HPP family protein [Deltaproteobacteria bacterium]|nr:HPP family protein [Deltaproteobacteria bacterium]